MHIKGFKIILDCKGEYSTNLTILHFSTNHSPCDVCGKTFKFPQMPPISNHLKGLTYEKHSSRILTKLLNLPLPPLHTGQSDDKGYFEDL